MAIIDIVLKANMGNPTVEVLIGQAHHGTYRLYLWDVDGKNSNLIGSGTNWDEVEDVFDLGPAAILDKRIITWEIAVSAEDSGPGQTYFVKVTFRQGGTPVEGGNFDESGSLQGSKIVYGARGHCDEKIIADVYAQPDISQPKAGRARYASIMSEENS